MNFWERFARNLLAAAVIAVLMALGVGIPALIVYVTPPWWVVAAQITGIIVVLCALDALQKGE